MKYLILGIAVVMYGFIIAFPKRKSIFALGAAAAMIVIGLLSGGAHGVGPVEAALELVNWNILLIYAGCLVLAELFVYSRAPAVLADKAVAKAPTLGIAIVILLVMTGILSMFVENVATVLVMAPIALAVCRKLKVDPAPFMMGLAVMANLQGTATLVGDPPSMIFASYASYSFNDFFFYDGRPSIFFAVQAGFLAGAAYFLFLFRKLPKTKVDLPDERVKSLVPSLLLVAMVVGLAAVSFVSGHGLHYGSGLLCFALGAAGIAWFAFVRKEPARNVWSLVRGLDWDSIGFLVGVFIVIGAIENAGLIADLASLLGNIVAGRPALAFLAILAVSVVISGFVDNVPYIIAMLPVADGLAKGMGMKPEFLMFALLVGSCLGGNLTPFGASANVVAMGILAKEGRKTGFPGWIRICLPFTIITTVAAAAFLALVWG